MAAFLATVALGAGIAASQGAFAQTAECDRLQAAIAAAPRGGNGQAQAAAERQRAELARTSSYARSIGCDNQKFLFFGSDPPAQCGQIKGQISRMQANLSDLESRGGGGGGQREALIARFNAQCANVPRQPTNILEALFGGGRPAPQQSYEPVDPNTIPPDQQRQMIEQSIDREKKGANVSAGSYAVCVKTCDGSFFPVSYGGAGSSLEDVCRSLCPNADVALYSFPFGGTIDQAVSISGERYVDLPNSLKFQQSFDSSCSCRRKGESWAQALAAAEARYGHGAKDIIVTPEKSAEMARPIIAKASTDPKAAVKAAKAGKAPVTQIATPAPAPPDAAQAGAGAAPTASATPGQTLDASGTDTALSAAAATVSREASGIGVGDAQSGAKYNEGQGQTVTETGPDGAKRKVRIVGPTL